MDSEAEGVQPGRGGKSARRTGLKEAGRVGVRLPGRAGYGFEGGPPFRATSHSKLTLMSSPVLIVGMPRMRGAGGATPKSVIFSGAEPAIFIELASMRSIVTGIVTAWAVPETVRTPAASNFNGPVVPGADFGLSPVIRYSIFGYFSMSM